MHLIADLDRNPLGSTTRCFLNLKAIAFFLSPDKRLGPVDPGSTQFHMETVHLLVPGSTAQTIPRFQHQGGIPTLLKITCSRDTGESSADHNNIN